MTGLAPPASSWALGTRWGASGTWAPTAAETALKVLRWAAGRLASDERHAGEPPKGSARSPSGVARSSVVTAELRELTRSTAAMLGAGYPILGDETPLTLGGAFLATAVGCREQADIARRLAALIRPPALGRLGESGWADALARHAVAGPALASVSELGDAWLAASPLTNVLVRPGEGQADVATDTALGLLARPFGRRMFVSALATCDPDPRVLLWRARLLGRLAQSHSGVVVEVYTAARARYRSEWDAALESAAQKLAGTLPGDQPDEGAVAAVRYWNALEDRRISRILPDTLWRDEVQPAVRLLRRYGLAERRAA